MAERYRQSYGESPCESPMNEEDAARYEARLRREARYAESEAESPRRSAPHPEQPAFTRSAPLPEQPAWRSGGYGDPFEAIDGLDWDDDPPATTPGGFAAARSAGWSARLRRAESMGGTAREAAVRVGGVEDLGLSFAPLDAFERAAIFGDDGDDEFYEGDGLVADARRRLGREGTRMGGETLGRDPATATLADVSTQLDAALGTLTQRLGATDLLPDPGPGNWATRKYGDAPSNAYDAPPPPPCGGSHRGGTPTLSQITENLDAALYAFTKTYQAKEAREKSEQGRIDKAREEERAQLEREVRAEHSLRLLESATAFEEIEAKAVRCCADCGCHPCDCGGEYGHSSFEELPLRSSRFAAAPAAPRFRGVPPECSLADCSRGVQAELDLALGLMQKRLGCAVMVASDGPTKAADPVEADPGVETEAERDARENKEKREKNDAIFERKLDEAEKRVTRRQEAAGAPDDLGSECSACEFFPCGAPEFVDAERRGPDYDLETDEAIDRFLAVRDDLAYGPDAGRVHAGEPPEYSEYAPRSPPPPGGAPPPREAFDAYDGEPLSDGDDGDDDAFYAAAPPPPREGSAFFSAPYGAARVAAAQQRRAATATLRRNYTAAPAPRSRHASTAPAAAYDPTYERRAASALDATLDARERLARVRSLRENVQSTRRGLY